ncbi:glycosyltransferase family 4 protein [Paenibacillus sp. FSL R7-0312]|uniref:glycosyltransferase family 4 protein n=1 Tax=Paenibacillus sp. FSL R7-0312 TaxID=2921682 RepID=UPI0030F8E793
MKKVLMLASVASMIEKFNMSNIRILMDLGYEVHIAANFEYSNTSSENRIIEFKKELEGLGIRHYHIDFSRKVTSISSHILAYRQIAELMSQNQYEFVHCHSPIGGVCGRIAAKRTRTKVIYTAHGFHFFKGAPLKNWLLYYPIERALANYTDVLITINHEDYNRASKSFKAKKVKYIPSVGLNTEEFNSIVVDKEAKRREIAVPEDAIMFLSVGELDSRKNHETPIRALANINNKNLYYVICGTGHLLEYLKNLCKELGVEKNVLLLGYRTDIAELCKSSDIYIFPSQREGLGMAALEGMSVGLPLISSYINGIRDYTEDGKTGFCLHPFDINGFGIAMEQLAGDADLRRKMGIYNQSVVENFEIQKVNKIMSGIYQDK